MNLITLSPSANTHESLIYLLQTSLVCALDISGQAKQAHWNVKGPNFIALHELFDKVHSEFMGYSDMLAERITALGSQAYGTIEVVSSTSKLKAYPLHITSQEDHLDALIKALAEFTEQIKTAARGSGDLGDSATEDLFIEIQRGTQKTQWLLKAHTQT